MSSGIRTKYLSLVALLIAALWWVNPLLAEEPDDENRPIVEFFPQDSFLHGFQVSPPRIAREIPLQRFTRLGPLLPPAAESPFWTLSQWHCVESLKDEDRLHADAADASEAVWENDYLRLRVAVDASGEQELEMTVDSLAIYDHAPISYEKMCVIRPHFLLGHNFYPDRDGVRRYGATILERMPQDAGSVPDLSAFDSLTLSMRLCLEKNEDLRHAYLGDRPVNRRRHYNRNPFQFWLRIYCRGPSSASHGQAFWLGGRVFDSEYPYASVIPNQRDQIESDAHRYAYKLCNLSVFGEEYEEKIGAFLAGKDTPIVIDVLEATRTALAAIQEQKEAFGDVRATLAGLTISSFNIGWEPASPFRGTMRFKDLSLQGMPTTP